MNDDNTLFQILEVTENPDYSQGICTTLVTQAKSEFTPDVQKRLPSNGVSVKEDFLPLIIPESNPPKVNEVNLTKLHAVEMLFQARKLSQLLAKSWLPNESEINRLIRKLFLTGDLSPDHYENTFPQDLKKHFELTDHQGLSDLYIVAGNLHNKNKSDSNDCDLSLSRSTLILPDGLNWQLIRLSLLFAGQAYLVKQAENEQKTYTPLCDPILSTYDICVYVAFTMISWSDYVAQRLEFTQPGRNAKPPYFKVTVPYPPLSLNDGTDLTEAQIKDWVNAPDEGGKWPFYPEKKNGEYVSELVRNIVPPYPYLPTSCC
jgi:hypothetical protein